MEVLKFVLVDNDVESAAFDCGNDSINDYIKNSYYPTIIQQAYTYEIISKGTTLGYYQVLLNVLSIEDIDNQMPEEIEKFDSNINDKLATLHLRFIAIDKKYQNKGIGTKVLERIIQKTIELCRICPIKLITLDAVNDKIEWYKNNKFILSHTNKTQQEGVTKFMYYPIILYKEQIEKYEDLCNA